MQPVLVIDLSRDPVTAHIIDVSSVDGTVIEQASVPFGNWYASYQLRQDLLDLAEEGAEDAGVSQLAITQGDLLIRTLIGQLSQEWTNSVLILPPLDYVSIELSTPFGDAARLRKILRAEVQDSLPFELDEMHMHYRAFQFLGSPDYHVHVGLMPRQLIADVLSWCADSGIEATVLCTTSSILSLFYDDFEAALPNAAVILNNYPSFSLGIFLEGKLCADSILDASFDEVEEEGRHSYIRKTLQDFRTAILSFERRHAVNIPQVFLIGDEVDEAQLKELFPSKEVRCFRLSKTGSNIHDLLVQKAALFGRDLRPPEPLVDFRSGEFRVGIRWKDLLNGMKQIFPYFLVLCLCVVIAVCALYYARESRLNTLRTTTVAHIKQLIPSIDPNTSRPAEFLQNEIALIQRQLRDLGSPFQLSPLDALIELSKDFQKRSNSTVKRVSIVGNKVTIEGTAPNYTALDTIEKAFKKKKRTYCNVKNTVSAAGGRAGSANNFSFTMELCE